jgi:hypothetical protein
MINTVRGALLYSGHEATQKYLQQQPLLSALVILLSQARQTSMLLLNLTRRYTYLFSFINVYFVFS